MGDCVEMTIKLSWRAPARRSACRVRRRRQVWAVTVAAAVAAALLCGCGQSRKLEGLMADLAEPQAEDAIKELVRMHEVAQPLLIEALEGSDADTPEGLNTTKNAMAVLVRAGDKEALELIGQHTRHADAQVRLVAIQGVAVLGQARKSLAVTILEAAMADENPDCVRAAAKGLAELEWEDAVVVLEGFLHTGEGVKAVFAAEALHKLDKQPEAARFILQSLSATDEAVRSAAAQVALERGDEFVAPAVAYAIEHPRQAEVEAVLSGIRDSLFEELAEKKLTAKRVQKVIEVIGQIADDASAERLIEIITTRDQGHLARVQAATVLGDAATSARPAGGRQSRQKIIAGLGTELNARDTDKRIKIACAISLCRLQQEAGVLYLLNELDRLEPGDVGASAESELLTELRIRAQAALTSSGQFVVPHLIEKVRDPNLGNVTAWAAATTLGELGVEQAVPHVGKMLTATVALQSVEPRRGDPGEVLKIETEKGDVQLEVSRRAILQAALAPGTPVPARGLYVRIAAARALGQIGGEEATRFLTQAQSLDEELHARLSEFVAAARYMDLIPLDSTDEAQEREASRKLEQLAQHIIEEEASVLFYLRQALRADAHENPLAGAGGF